MAIIKFGRLTQSTYIYNKIYIGRHIRYQKKNITGKIKHKFSKAHTTFLGETTLYTHKKRDYPETLHTMFSGQSFLE